MEFQKLIKTDCSHMVEKKGKYDYLAWAFAIEQLRIHEPKATISARMFDGLPYIDTGNGLVVEIYIMVDGNEVWNEWLPVLDFSNKALKNPNAFDINKAFQRCKVKCIAEYTGIGLNLYRKESAAPTPKKETKKVTIGTDNLNDLTAFCKRHNITGKKAKAELLDHYKVDVYKTTIQEFNDIFETMRTDQGESLADN